MVASQLTDSMVNVPREPAWVRDVSDRFTILNRCLLGMAAVVVCSGLLWLRWILNSPTLLEILALPILVWTLGIVSRVLLGWVLAAAPAELRLRPRGRRLAHLSLSILVTVVAIAALYGTAGPFGLRATTFVIIICTGEISLSVAFKLVDCLLVVVRAVEPVPTTTSSHGPPDRRGPVRRRWRESDRNGRRAPPEREGAHGTTGQVTGQSYESERCGWRLTPSASSAPRASAPPAPRPLPQT